MVIFCRSLLLCFFVLFLSLYCMFFDLLLPLSWTSLLLPLSWTSLLLHLSWNSSQPILAILLKPIGAIDRWFSSHIMASTNYCLMKLWWYSFIPDKHAGLVFFSTNYLQQQFMVWHVAPLEYIIIIPWKQLFALIHICCSQPQVIKFTSCLLMLGGSLRVLRLLPPLKLVAMI